MFVQRFVTHAASLSFLLNRIVRANEDGWFDERYDMLDAMRTHLEQKVQRLSARGIRPCALKARTRGRSLTTGSGRSEEIRQGEGMLVIARDGSFNSSISFSTSGTGSVPPCSWNLTAPGQLQVSGSYRESDSKLVFEHVSIMEGTRTINETCTAGPSAGSRTETAQSALVISEVQAALGQELSVPFADGLSLSIPLPPAPDLVWEFNLDLSFEPTTAGS